MIQNIAYRAGSVFAVPQPRFGQEPTQTSALDSPDPFPFVPQKTLAAYRQLFQQKWIQNQFETLLASGQGQLSYGVPIELPHTLALCRSVGWHDVTPETLLSKLAQHATDFVRGTLDHIEGHQGGKSHLLPSCLTEDRLARRTDVLRQMANENPEGVGFVFEKALNQLMAEKIADAQAAHNALYLKSQPAS